jgi:hypothetical protein
MRRIILLCVIAAIGFAVGIAATLAGAEDEIRTLPTQTFEVEQPEPAPARSRSSLQRGIWRLRTHVLVIRGCREPVRILSVYTMSRSQLERELRFWKAKHRRFHQSDRCAWLEGDFHRALELASKTFRVSYSWLHNCDHDEGSDRMVWNTGGSGAFGPMQFMRGTFYSNVGRAFSTARARGVKLPARFARWDSNVGQAFTAASMFSRGLSSHWTGASC